MKHEQQRTNFSQPSNLSLPYGMRLTPSQAAFWRAEGVLFRKACAALARESPRIEKYLQGLAERIENPVLRLSAIELVTIPYGVNLQDQATKKMQELSQLLSRFASTHAEREQIKSAAHDEVFKPLETVKSSAGKLVDELIEHLPNFQKLYTTLAGTIEQFAERRPRGQSVERALQHEATRNYLTAEAFGSHGSGLLFWDLEILLQAAALSTANRTWRTQLYEDLKVIAPDMLAAQAPQVDVRVGDPKLGETRRISAEEYFERMAKEEPTPTEIARVREVTGQFFEARRRQVWPSQGR